MTDEEKTEHKKALSRERNRRYYRQNRDLVLKRSRENRQEHPEARRAATKKYRDTHKPELLQSQREYREKKREAVNENRRRRSNERYATDPAFREKAIAAQRARMADPLLGPIARDGQMAAFRRRTYGMEPEDYESLLEAQMYVCAICGEPHVEEKLKGLHVDHDHDTGAVRGLLCNTCNRAIGLLKDNPVILEAAARYLRDADVFPWLEVKPENDAAALSG